MSWIDDILTSSFIVWAIIGLGAFSLYLKKSGKTVVEVFNDIREFFSNLMEDKNDGGTAITPR